MWKVEPHLLGWQVEAESGKTFSGKTRICARRKPFNWGDKVTRKIRKPISGKEKSFERMKPFYWGGMVVWWKGILFVGRQDRM